MCIELIERLKLPAIEFVGVLFPRVVEVQTEVGIDANPKVIVHHEYLGVVFALGACGSHGWRNIEILLMFEKNYYISCINHHN